MTSKEKKQIIEKLRKRIKKLEDYCRAYQRRNELRKKEKTIYNQFIEKLKLEGRVTKEELMNYFKKSP